MNTPKTFNGKMTRRGFVKNTANCAISALAVSFTNPNLIMGANERINFALIGCGGRGRWVARGLIEQGAELVTLCDLRDERLDKTEEFLQEVLERKPKRVKEMHRVFENKDVDAVVIATPDHWHALPTVLACQAGKDVYVEKPHAHSIWESRKMIEASEKYKRIVQVGTQNRSAPYVLAAKEYIRSGKLGEIGLVKVYNLKSGRAFFLGEPGTPPADFKWDVWLGPAPQRPYHESIYQHGWLSYWDFCNGDMSDDGIHQMDLTMLVLGDPDIPSKISSTGGRFVYRDDDAEVPDVQTAIFTYKDFILDFEMTNYPRYMQKTTTTIRRNDEFPYWTQNATRIEIYGSELLMTIGRMGGGWQTMTSGGRVIDQMYGRPPDENHYKNFVECVKNRTEPTADIKIAHNAFSAIMLAVIAHKCGNRTVNFDPVKERFINDPEADKLLKRAARKGYEIPDSV
jgi:predicted dehydrogenase